MVEPRASILVVEDDGFIAADLQRTLELLGYQADRSAATAAEALDLAMERAPDLVLMDIHLKGPQDGIDAATALRASLNLPVIYLIAYMDEATVARAKATTPLGYLQKPFSEPVLRTTLEIAFQLDAATRRLRAQERWLSTILHGIGEAVISTDASGQVTFLNTAAESLTGWTLAEAAGRQLAVILPVRDEQTGKPAAHPALRSLAERVSIQSTGLTVRTRSLQDRPFEGSTSPILDERGALLGAVMVFRDTSELRRSRQQLEFSNRMSALGTMAAGLAHEINNPLSFVTANLRYALDGLPKNPARQAAQGAAAQSFVEVEDALREAEIGGKRIAQIVSSLQTFVRQPDPSDSRASPAEALRWALNITQLELRRRARVVTEIADLPQVRCNETRLSQVFINLLLNAAQAIPPGGPHEHRVSVVGRVDGDGWVVVEVSDTGEGIAPAVLGRIFEPFFTTREIGQGAGLGLSISHAIVESAGGQLTATSEVGRGSTFRVRLPVAPGQQKAPAGPGQPGRRRILVIDDEPMILRLVQRILADEHQVTTLDSAEKALVLLAEGARFDVIICDLMMPGLNGIDLHSALVRDYPDQVERIVFISGGATSARTADFLAQFPDHQLEKPFNHAVLRAMISRIPALPAATNPPGA